jgi:hypothetical protein
VCLAVFASTLVLSADLAFARIGRPVWTPGGVAISTAPGEQGVAQYGAPGIDMIPDSAGGAFLVWEDRSGGNILAQRVNAAGQPQWPANVAVAPGAWFQFSPRIIADGSGGAIIAWGDGRNGFCGLTFAGSCDIFAQRLNAAGQPQWQAGGVSISTADANQGVGGLAIGSDGAGGAIIAWEDARPPNCCRIFAQRVNGSGQVQWAANGIAISPPPTWIIGGIGASLFVISDTSGGAVIAWLDQQVNPVTDFPRVALQRVDAAGQALWGPTGVPVGPASRSEFSVIPDGSGGVIAAWAGSGQGGFPDVFAQHVNASGQALWQANGVHVIAAPLQQYYPQVVTDGAGGAIVTWEDDRNFQDFHCPGFGGNCEIYAQRVNAAGQVVWNPAGVPIAAAAANQFGARLVPDGSGGAIIAWHDCRNSPGRDPCLGDPVTLQPGGMDLYGQRVNAAGQTLWGTWGTPVAQAAGNQGTHYGTRLNASFSFAMIGDGVGGAFVAWPDGRSGFCVPTVILTLCDVFVQRVTFGTATAGLYNGATSTFYLRNTNSAGAADLTFAYGPPGAGWLPLMGDWDGDGLTTVGLYNPMTAIFYLRNTNTPGPADVVFAYGPPAAGWTPVVGDWNGDGVDTVGLFDAASGTFYLRNVNGPGPADLVFGYGPPGANWAPIVGDWDGDGLQSIGLFSGAASTFYLRNSNTAGPADLTFAYGPPGASWRALAGDWNGNATASIGLYNGTTSTFLLRNTNNAGVANLTFPYGPAGQGWVPVTGTWGGL